MVKVTVPTDTIKSVFDAVKELTSLLREWIAGANIRQMKAAIQAAESYILTNESTTLKQTERAKLLLHYRKRFFAHN